MQKVEQIRWVDRQVKYIQPFNSVFAERDKGVECIKVERVLQVKVRSDHTKGLSDWIDVPVEGADHE